MTPEAIKQAKEDMARIKALQDAGNWFAGGNVGNSRTVESERNRLYNPNYSVSTDPFYDNARASIGLSSDTGGQKVAVTQDPVKDTKSEEDAARERYETRKREIESRLQAMKEYAGRLKESAVTARDNTYNTIGDTYAKLKQLIQDKLSDSMKQLDLTDVDVQNTYGRLSGNVRRAMESSLTKGNLLAKALGNAGSSFYQNLQAKNEGQGRANLFDTEAEQAAKRSAVDVQKSSTTSEFGQHEIEAGEEEKDMRNRALEKYNTDIANAELLEKNYNIDSEAAIAQANANLDDAYRQIDIYTRSRTPAATSGNTYSAINSKIPTYDAKANIGDEINNNAGQDTAKQYLAQAEQGTNASYYPAGNAGLASLDIIKKNANKKQYDPTQYYQYYS